MAKRSVLSGPMTLQDFQPLGVSRAILFLVDIFHGHQRTAFFSIKDAVTRSISSLAPHI